MVFEPACGGGGGGGGSGGGGGHTACGCPVENDYRIIAGCVQVEDEGANIAQAVAVPNVGTREVVPLVDVQIYAWDGFFVERRAQSSEQGCFRINHVWSRHRRVRTWTKWKNDNVKVNGWTPGTGSAIRLGVDRDMGSEWVRTDADFNNVRIIYTNINGRDSRSQVWYNASNALNTVARGIAFSEANDLPVGNRRLRWVISNADADSGAAPMMKATGTSFYVQAGACGGAVALTGPIPGAILCVAATAAGQLIPDI